MELIMNEQGEYELYDDTYDVVIHCDSEKARDDVLADLKAMNERLDVLDNIRAEIEEQVLESLSDGGDDWFAAEKVNECLEIIDKYKTESEDKE